MKSIQFKLSEEKYEKTRKKLEEAGLTWQRVCEQLSDHIVHSEFLDEFGLPLLEMTPSIRQQTRSALDGHIETALWKYVQIQNNPESRDRNHWMSALQGVLKQVIRVNSRRTFRDGYIFDLDQLESILNAMWPEAIWLTSKHLGIDPVSIKVKKPSLKELFKFADIHFSLKR